MGKGLFLKQQPSPILNNFDLVDKVSEISSATLKIIEDKVFTRENELTKQETEKLNFPLNNVHCDFLTNISNSVSYNNSPTNNTLFIAFEISNSEKILEGEKNKNCFINLDSGYINKEIEFLLNV